MAYITITIISNQIDNYLTKDALKDVTQTTAATRQQLGSIR